jgi:ElaB/YqjD/DUF883 family membrane-anchored ribosome-binding protein
MNSGKITGSPSSQTDVTSSTKRSGSGSSSSTTTGDLRAKAGEAVSKITDAAHQAVDEAKRSTSSFASDANEKVRGILDQQVAAGADIVSQVAESARIAAQNLDQNIPQLANLVRDASERIEEFSREIRSQSASELADTISQFARRRPAVVFGMAAACGFVAFRLLNASSSTRRPSANRDFEPRLRTDWRPEPRLGGSAYPAAGAATSSASPNPYPSSGVATSSGSSPSPYPTSGAATSGASSTHPSSPGSTHPSTPGGNTPYSGTPGAGSTQQGTGETSRPKAPSPGQFHGT